MGNDSSDPILSELKTEAAKRARKSFERQVEEQQNKEQQIAFNILVWGMAPDRDVPIAQKRKDIGNQLIEDGHNAMFSEDLSHLKIRTFRKRVRSLLRQMLLISLSSLSKVRLVRWPKYAISVLAQPWLRRYMSWCRTPTKLAM